jgi:hypothetical protein
MGLNCCYGTSITFTIIMGLNCCYGTSITFTIIMGLNCCYGTSITFTIIMGHILLSNKSYSAFCCQKNGLVIAKSCISSRFFVIVALNNNVCLFFGKTSKIVSNCSPKSSSINLSASSSTYKNKQNFKHYLNLLHPNHP